jgi:hypothetical protein
MHRTYNIAILLIRFFGFSGVVFGLMWLGYIVVVLCLHVFQAPSSVTLPIWENIVQQNLSGPIWLATGVIVLRNSQQLAVFLTKFIKPDEDS